MDTEITRLGRRRLLQRGGALALAIVSLDALAGCAPGPVAGTSTATPAPTPLPAPEATAIRLTAGACDAPLMAAEAFLREEGFTDVQISDAGTLAALTGGKAELGQMFATPLIAAVDAGKPVIGLAGIHPACAEIWAPQSIASLADLRGRTVVVRAKTADDLAYTFLAIALKNAGVDPKDVAFVAQADADTTKAYLEGKSDAVFVTATAAIALRANAANKGHVILDQMADKPWAEQDCCILAANADWARTNPNAAKRAVRAVMRAADSLGADRAPAVKLATDKGLFGGAKNYEAVRGAANMVPLDWRALDIERSIRFHAGLMADAGLLRSAPDETVRKGVDGGFVRRLRTDLPR